MEDNPVERLPVSALRFDPKNHSVCRCSAATIDGETISRSLTSIPV